MGGVPDDWQRQLRLARLHLAAAYPNSLEACRPLEGRHAESDGRAEGMARLQHVAWRCIYQNPCDPRAEVTPQGALRMLSRCWATALARLLVLTDTLVHHFCSY